MDPEWGEDRHKVPLPEHRLLVAIVRRAVWDFVLYRDSDDPKKHQYAEDAVGWIFWNGEEAVDDEGRYTFLYICNHLGLDAATVRQVMLKLTRDDIRKLNNYIKEQ